MSSIRTQRTLTICGLIMELWAIVHYFDRGQCNFWACSLTCRLLAFCGLLRTLNLGKMALVSNGNLVSFSREAEKMGDFFKFLQAVDSRAIWM